MGSAVDQLCRSFQNFSTECFRLQTVKRFCDRRLIAGEPRLEANGFVNQTVTCITAAFFPSADMDSGLEFSVCIRFADKLHLKLFLGSAVFAEFLFRLFQLMMRSL